MIDSSTYTSAESMIPVVRDAVADVMDVNDVMVGGQATAFRNRSAATPVGEGVLAFILRSESRMGEALRLRGRLLMPAEEAYNRLVERLRPLDRTPVLRRAENGRDTILLVLPGVLRPARQRVAVAALLFVLTALSCLYVGALLDEGTTSPFNLLHGVPYAASLLSILLAHEFGHYLMARRLGAPVSLPYFIPLPVPPLGTLGAVINMVAPPRNRRHLLAIGAAGPLAGLAVAIPILLYGRSLSHVQRLPEGGYMMEGNSLLYLGLKFLEFGRLLPSGGWDVFIHPVAFAGWAGLLVTALNLIPAGQLDGGHVFYALVGERAAQVMLWVVLLGLALLSFLYLGWLLWVALVFFFGRLRVPLMDDVTQLGPGQRALGVAMLIVFALVFTPIPMSLVR
jgi:membrane-associated protease RseP (regulator of RpoE activity)